MLQGYFMFFLETEKIADDAVGLCAVPGLLNTIVRKVNQIWLSFEMPQACAQVFQPLKSKRL